MLLFCSQQSVEKNSPIDQLQQQWTTSLLRKTSAFGIVVSLSVRPSEAPPTTVDAAPNSSKATNSD